MSTTTTHTHTHSRQSSTYNTLTTSSPHLLLTTPLLKQSLPTELLLPILSAHLEHSFATLPIKAFASLCLTLSSVSTLFLMEITRLVEPISGAVHERYMEANTKVRMAKRSGEGLEAGETYRDGLRRMEAEVERAWERVTVVAGLRGKLRSLGVAMGVGR